jgi:serine/threonine protein kinase
MSTWSGACSIFARIRSRARCTTFMCPWRVGSSGRSPNRTDRRWVYTLMPSIIVPRTSMTARTPSALINSSIQAVAELHKHGIIHGDLHPGNVLFCIPGIDSWTISDFRHHLGEARKLRVEELRDDYPDLPSSSPHLPEYLVYSSHMPALVPLCHESPVIKIM